MLPAKLRTDQLFKLSAAGRYDAERYVTGSGLEGAFSDSLRPAWYVRRPRWIWAGKTSWSARVLLIVTGIGPKRTGLIYI